MAQWLCWNAALRNGASFYICECCPSASPAVRSGGQSALPLGSLSQDHGPSPFLRGCSTSDGEVRRLRKSNGQMAALRQPRYNFTAGEPDYFTRAANDPDDFLGKRIVASSGYGEASFKTAMKYLAPTPDYTLIGTPEGEAVAAARCTHTLCPLPRRVPT